MEDREFEVFQELRSLIVSRLEAAKYSEENVEEFCTMLAEDLPSMVGPVSD